MNNNVDIVNTARATYHYMLDSSRDSIVQEVSYTVTNTLSLSEQFEIRLCADKCRVVVGECYCYIVEVTNTGNMVSGITIVDELSESLEVMCITIDGVLYQNINDIYSGINIESVNPGQKITMSLKVKVINASNNPICNSVYGISMGNTSQNANYYSNEVCICVIDGGIIGLSCIVYNRDLCCINNEILSINQYVDNYYARRCRNGIAIKAFIISEIIFVNSYGIINHIYYKSCDSMFISLCSSCLCVSGVNICTDRPITYKICRGKVIINSEICIVADND